MNNVLWMKVSDDEYEFPEKIMDSAKELADYYGVNVVTIYSAISHAQKRGGRSSYIKVKIDEEV